MPLARLRGKLATAHSSIASLALCLVNTDLISFGGRTCRLIRCPRRGGGRHLGCSPASAPPASSPVPSPPASSPSPPHSRYHHTCASRWLSGYHIRLLRRFLICDLVLFIPGGDVGGGRCGGVHEGLRPGDGWRRVAAARRGGLPPSAMRPLLQRRRGVAEAPAAPEGAVAARDGRASY